MWVRQFVQATLVLSTATADAGGASAPLSILLRDAKGLDSKRTACIIDAARAAAQQARLAAIAPKLRAMNSRPPAAAAAPS